MSDEEDRASPDSIGDDAKRRKLLRACDVCRRKRTRCDVHSLPGNRCTQCKAIGQDCTFVEDAKKRGPPKGYIDDLERRCELLEKLILRLSPNIDLEREVGPKFTKETWAAVRGLKGGRTPRHLPANTPSPPSLASISSPPTEAQSPRSTSDDLNSDGEEGYSSGTGLIMKSITLGLGDNGDLPCFERRFHGKSSGVSLLQVAMQLRGEVLGHSGPIKPLHLRPKYWRPNPWEWMASPLPSLDTIQFPPEDLAPQLIDYCFTKVMVLFPAVHRPWFENQRHLGLHKRDPQFAKTYLLICAVGSRYSDDERVCVRNPSGEPEWISAGWPYFVQAMQLNRPLLAPARLSDLQCAVLACIYLQGTSGVQAAWMLIGFGLRLALDIGAHREKVYAVEHPYENQMWKRAFWCLVALDRIFSAGLGRPIGTLDEDVDAELPVEVDDEYYDEETRIWKQPEGKPSVIAAFNHYAKLQRIVAYAIRTVYSINKSKVHLGFVGPDWENRTVAEIDSALNSWLDSTPEHLVWRPDIENDTFFEQAALLRLSFHYVGIILHRPFIPYLFGSKSPSQLSMPSLIMCTNAARSVSSILAGYSKRMEVGWPLTYITAFAAGTVLLSSIWNEKKNGLKFNYASRIAAVHECVNYLKRAETRWHSAGRFYDILHELASMDELQVNRTIIEMNNRKRARADDEDDQRRRRSQVDPLVNAAALPDSASTTRAPDSSVNRDFSTQLSGGLEAAPATSADTLFAQLALTTPTAAQGVGLNTQGAMPTIDPLLFQGSYDPFAFQQGVLPGSGWENYSLAGYPVPGMNAGMSRMGGLGVPPVVDGQQGGGTPMSPTVLYQEFLVSLQGLDPSAVFASTAGNQVWSQQEQQEFDWMASMGLRPFMSPTP